jgi:hypothetical protein
MIVLSEGFGASTNIADFQNYGLLGPSFGGRTQINTGGPLGDNYLTPNLANNGWQYLRALPAPLSTLYVGMRISQYSGTDIPLALVSSGGVTQITFQLSSLGTQILMYQGNPTGTLLGTITLSTPITTGTWSYVEFGVVVGTGTSGSVTVRQAGIVVGTITGVDTSPDTTNVNVRSLVFGGTGGGWASKTAHVYITNSTTPNAGFLGDVRVFSRFPTGNSAVAFTPTGLAANWENAAKVPPLPATDYNTDATVGAQDTFAAAALPSGLGNIFAVGMKTLFQDAGAGARTVENVLVSGATTGTGTAGTPPVSPSATYQCDIFNTDPNTSAAWTAANAQAATFGYKIAS